MSGESKLTNPFPGLRAFRADEDYLFFGREEQTLELLQRLGTNRFVAVVGTSGSGKSSLVRCGLLSELLGGKMLQAGAAWEVAVTHPGGNPLAILTDALLDADLYDREEENVRENLLATLSRSHFGLVEAVKQAGLRPDTNFLLVVDQFEEIFRFHEAGQEQQEAANEFVSILLEAVAQKEVPIYIVLTMRSDFIGECGQFEGLAEMVNRGEFLIPRLTREQYKRVIEGPIKVAGGQITPRLLQRLLNDLGQQADQLPCLQHALMRTWNVWAERGDADALDLDDYQRVGKMSQALSLHADEVYASLASDRERELCRGIFQALTVQESENRGIRRPQRLGALCQILDVSADELIPIIDAYRQHGVTFLMPSPEVELTEQTIIDISHESLMRVWSQLRQWVEEEAQAAGIYRRLSESAALYEQGKAGLYRDPELGIALAWRETKKPNEAWARRYHRGFSSAIEFLEKSQKASVADEEAREAARQRELAQAQQLAAIQRLQLEQQQRSARRLRGMLAGLAVVAVIAGIACVAAMIQYQKANELADVASEEADNARNSAIEADRLRVEAESSQQETQRLLVQVEESLEITKQAQEDAQEQAIAAERAREEADRQRLIARRSLYSSTLFTAQRSIESPGSTARHGELLADLRPQAGEVDLRDWEWYYLQAQAEEKQLTLRGHSGRLCSASYSPDGERLLTAGADGIIKIWHARKGTELFTLAGHGDTVWDANWSHDGRWIASGGADNVIKIWDAETGVEVRTLTGHKGVVYSVEFSKDDTLLASGSADHRVKIWDFETGAELQTLPGHSDAVWAVGWSSDGEQLASAGADLLVGIWDVEDGTLVRVLSGHIGMVYGLAWSHDGQRIATAGQDGAQVGIHLWEVETGEEIRTLKGHANTVFRVTWSHDDTRLASAGLDNTARLWDTETGEQVRMFAENSEWVMDVEFSDDDQQLLTAVADGSARIQDVERYDGFRIPLLSGVVTDIVWSPDGRIIATPTDLNTVVILDVATQTPITTFLGHTAHALSVDLSPDGTHAVSGGSDRMVRVWDVTTAEEIWNAECSADGDVNRVAWNPQGGRIACAGDDGTVRIFDAETGEQLHSLRADKQDAIRLTLAWSPDGTLLASDGFETDGSSNDEVIVVWNAETGEVAQTLRYRGATWGTVAFSPDGNRVVAGGSIASDDTFGGTNQAARGVFVVWDLESGQELFSQDAHQLPVTAVEWNRDGTRMLSAGLDGTLRIWAAETGQELLAIDDDAVGSISAARFSPDGLRIAAAAGGEAIRIWDAIPGYASELSPRLIPLLSARIDAAPAFEDLKLRGEILARQGEWDLAAADFQSASELQQGFAVEQGSPWFVSPWWVVGPFPESLDAQQPPESHLNPMEPVPVAMNGAEAVSEPLSWQAISLKADQGLDLGRFFQQAEHVSGYAQLRIYSPVEQSAGVLLGADDTLRVWLNGELLHMRTESRAAARDDEALEIPLQPGWNTLLTKVSNSTQNHGLFLRLTENPTELARVFERTNHWDRAFVQWTRAAELRPEDAQTLFALGRAALFAGDDASAEQALTAAAQHAPDLATGWQQVRRIYQDAGRASEAANAMAHAVAALEEQIAAAPEDVDLPKRLITAQTDLVIARLELGVQLWQDSRLAEAVAAWQSADELMQSLRDNHPADQLDIARLANANRAVIQSYVQHGLWEDAAQQAVRYSDGRIDTETGVFITAALHLFAGDLDAYRNDCRQMLEFAATNLELSVVPDRAGKMCLWVVGAVEDLEPALELADRAVMGTEQDDSYVWFQLVKGLAEYRRGNDQAVIEWLETNRREHEFSFLHSSEDFLVAMANHRLGRTGEARTWLDRALERVADAPMLGSGEFFTSVYALTDQMRWEILRNEAETLINDTPRAADPARSLQRAMAFSRLGRIEQANAELAAAGEAATANLSGLVIRAHVLAHSGDATAVDALHTAAQQLADQASSADDASVNLWMMLAEGYAAAGLHAAAADAYRTAATMQSVLVSGNSGTSGADLRQLEHLYELLAAAYESAGQTEQALVASDVPDLVRIAFDINDPFRPRPQRSDATRQAALTAINDLVADATDVDVSGDPAGQRYLARLYRQRAALSQQASQSESATNDLLQARLLLEAVLTVQTENIDCADELAGVLGQTFESWFVPRPDSIVSQGGATLAVQSDGSILASGTNPNTDTYTVVIDPGQPFVTGIKLELLPDPSMPFSAVGRATENGNCVLSEFEVAVVGPEGGAGTPVAWRSALSDHRVAAADHYGDMEMHAANAIDGDLATYWESWPRSTTPKTVLFLPHGRIETPDGTRLVVRLISASHTRHTLGRFRLSLTGSPTPEVEGGQQITSPLVRLATAYANLGEPELAATYFARVLDTTAVIAERRAIIDQAIGWEEAFAELLELRPDEPLIHIALSRKYTADGEFELAAKARDRAQSLLEQAYADHPEDESHATMLADFLLESSGDDTQWTILHPIEAISSGGAILTIQDDGSILAGGETPSTDTYTIVADTPTDGVTAIRLEALTDDSLPQRGPGRFSNGNFVLSEFVLSVGDAAETAPTVPRGRYVRIELPGSNRILTLAEVQVFDGPLNLALSGFAQQSSVDYGGLPEKAIDGNTDGVYSNLASTHTLSEANPWWELDLGAEREFDHIVIWNRTDGLNGGRLAGFLVAVLDESRQLVFEQFVVDPPTPSIGIDLSATSRISVPFSAAFADYSQNAQSSQDVLLVEQAIDGDPRSNSGWGIHPQGGRDHHAIFELADPSIIEGNSRLTFRLVQNWEAHPLGKFRVAATTSPQPSQALQLRQAIADGYLSGLGALAAARSLESDLDTALATLDAWHAQFAADSVRIEAEDCDSIEDPWQVVDDDEASGGSYVFVPNGSGDNYRPDLNPQPQALDYDFHIERSGDYRFFVLCQGHTGNDDSFWVSMDGSVPVQWSLDTGEHWAWGTAATAQSFFLAAGDHTLRIGNREDGFAVDAFLLVPESAADAFATAAGWHAAWTAMVRTRFDQPAEGVAQVRELARWGDLSRSIWQQPSFGAVGQQAVALAIDSAPDADELYDFQGRALGWQNRRTEAIAAYTRALAIDPQRIDTRSARAALYADLNDNESALADYNIAIDGLQGQDYNGAIRKAQLLARARGDVNNRLERWADAARDYRQFLAAVPATTDVELIARMADAHTRAQQWQQAVDAWTRALSLAPDNQTYLQWRLDRYTYDLREYELALADTNRLLEISPNSPWPRIRRAEIYMVLRDLDRALSNLFEALRVATDDNSRSLIFQRRASVYALQGDWEQALAEINRTSSLRVPADRIWEVARHRALLLIWLGNQDAYREAAAEMERALSGSTDGHRARVLLWTLLLNPDGIPAQDRDRLLELPRIPGDRWLPRLTADIHLRTGRADEAARLYDQDPPQEAFELFSAAHAQHLLGDQERARQYIINGNRELDKLRMRDRDAIVPPGVDWEEWLSHLIRKREVEGIVVAPHLAAVDQALQADPENDALLIARAEINAAYGRIEELLIDLGSTSSDLSDAALLSRRAALLAYAGRLDQARAAYEQLAALEPENSLWSERLAQLTPQTSAVWNFDSSTEGWTGNTQVTLTATGGMLRTESLDVDPILFQTVSAPSGWHVLTIKARAPQELPFQLWWNTVHGGASEETSRRTTIPNTGEDWHVERIWFQSIGNLTGLRLDPGDAAGQQWEIDSITLESLDSESLSALAEVLIDHVAQGSATDSDASELSAVLEAFPKTPLVANAEDWNAEPTFWRYTIFEPATDWMTEGFDDKAWSTGPTPFGSAHESAVWSWDRGRTRWADDDIWLRHEFELIEMPSGPLTFRLKYDDDVEVYVNGVQAVELGGASDYVDAACSPEAAAALRPGRNVIAVHCVDHGSTSMVDVGLYVSGSNDRMLEIVNAAINDQPDNQPLRRLRGDIQFDRQEWQAAVDDYNVLIDPASPNIELVTRRAESLTHLGQWELAAADYGILIEQRSGGRSWTSQRSNYLLDLSQQEELYTALLDARPEDTHLQLVWCRHLALTSRWAEAAEVIDWAAAPSDVETEEWFEIAGLLLINNDTAEYQELLTAAARELDAADPLSSFTLARTYGLADQPLETAEQAVRWAESAVDADSTAWYQHALGLALYRAGRYEEAIVPLEESNASTWAEDGKAQNWLVLAMIHHKLGDDIAAQEWLKRFDDWFATVVEQADGGRINMPTTDWFGMHVLSREARSLITPEDSPPQ